MMSEEGIGTNRICSQCGRSFSNDVNKCPTCQDETFDLSSSEDLEYLKYLVRIRQAVRFGKAFGISFGVFFSLVFPLCWGFGLGYYFLYYVLFIVLGYVLEGIMFRRLTPSVQDFEKRFIKEFPESRFFKTKRVLSFLFFIVVVLIEFCW